jgi:hypothetical protein
MIIAVRMARLLFNSIGGMRSVVFTWRKDNYPQGSLSDPFAKNGVTEMVRVRRERRLVHSGCKSHPGTGSFRPVAIGAAVEVTKLLKPPVEEGRKGDSASVQAVT